MDEQRKTDRGSYTKFRTRRFTKSGGNWFFFTREGTMEGPFGFLHEAEERLDIYKKVMSSGFMPLDSKLSIEPIDTPVSR